MGKHNKAGRLHHLIEGLTPEPAQRGAQRYRLSTPDWIRVIAQLGRGIDLSGLWTDNDQVHMAVLETANDDFFIVSHDITNGTFPSVAASHAPAILCERIIKDLYGVVGDGLPDGRPWTDHGNWPLSQPLASKPGAIREPVPYVYHGALGEGLHQIAVGPVHAGIIEPGHFRFFCAGETVVRLEARLGYTHKGIEKLLEGKTPQQAAPICARISGDSTVAYSIAFARVVEIACDVEIPERAHWLRALMGELERLANHFGDIGAICNDASFSLMHTHCSILREHVLRAADSCFGHRLMRDQIVPGGVATNIGSHEIKTLQTLIGEIRRDFPPLINLYDNTASLQDRTVGTGFLKPELAQQYAASGFIGRASGRSFDTRRMPGYPPYDSLSFDVPVRREGDVNARIWIRILEVEQSLSMIEQILDKLPKGKISKPLPSIKKPCEGFALAEGFRGDILVWLRLGKDGRIMRCHMRDPSWFQWPLLEVVIEGNIVADFPLCNKSFNCSYSGHDL